MFYIILLASISKKQSSNFRGFTVYFYNIIIFFVCLQMIMMTKKMTMGTNQRMLQIQVGLIRGAKLNKSENATNKGRIDHMN